MPSWFFFSLLRSPPLFFPIVTIMYNLLHICKTYILLAQSAAASRRSESGRPVVYLSK